MQIANIANIKQFALQLAAFCSRIVFYNNEKPKRKYFFPKKWLQFLVPALSGLSFLGSQHILQCRHAG
jgi:hypothetical protein